MRGRGDGGADCCYWPGRSEAVRARRSLSHRVGEHKEGADAEEIKYACGKSAKFAQWKPRPNRFPTVETESSESLWALDLTLPACLPQKSGFVPSCQQTAPTRFRGGGGDTLRDLRPKPATLVPEGTSVRARSVEMRALIHDFTPPPAIPRPVCCSSGMQPRMAEPDQGSPRRTELTYSTHLSRPKWTRLKLKPLPLPPMPRSRSVRCRLSCCPPRRRRAATARHRPESQSGSGGTIPGSPSTAFPSPCTASSS